MDPSRKSNTPRKSNTFNLTADLLYIILPNLPVKTITRWKVVSKAWLELIEEETAFRNKYNRRPIADDQVMIINYKEKARPFSLYQRPKFLTGNNFALFDVLDTPKVTNIGFPFPEGEFPWHPRTLLVGSDFGLVCVAVPLVPKDFPPDYPLVKQQIQIYLWNPATKKSKSIPPPPVIDPNVCTFGFGYDSTDAVFKVVCIGRKSRVAVYSTMENLNWWREIDLNDPSFQQPVRSSFDLCLHGYLLGVAKDGMMCFGLNNEVLTSRIKLPLPLGVSSQVNPRTLMNYGNVVEFQGRVSYCRAFKGRVSLWTLDNETCLQDVNVNASWTLKTVITLDYRATERIAPHALCFFNDQHIVVENSQHDIYSQKYKPGTHNEAIYVPVDFNLTQAFKYRESLVLLPGFKTVSRRKEDLDCRILLDKTADLTDSELTQDPCMWFKDGKHFLGDFSFATIQANADMQDYSQVETKTNATFVGVYDGHGGSAASRYIRDHLFANLVAIVKQSGKMSTDKLRQAFAETEAGFLSFVEATSQDDPLIAAVGSCCLVGVIWEGKLFIASLGDSRAVKGRVLGDRIDAVALTYDHNANIEEVREKLRSAHPSDPKIVSRDREDIWRVKGILQVTRTIGDAYLKKPGFALDPRSRVHLKEPLHQPVLDANPQLYEKKLKPGDKFLIFASNGLWEHLTNEKAVEIVSNNPRPGIAKRLIESALERKFNMHLNKLGKGVRRMYHDDITVVVIFLYKEWPQKNDVQEESVLGGTQPVD